MTDEQVLGISGDSFDSAWAYTSVRYVSFYLTEVFIGIDWPTLLDSVLHTALLLTSILIPQVPIQESLLFCSDSEMNELAAKSFMSM